MTSPASSSTPPNVIVILADDLGYSDIGCYGGEIDTPNLDRLARGGVRATAFYNTARCSPSRASLLTGMHPHQTGIGILTEPLAPYGGYPGSLDPAVPTIAERLHQAGYATCASGKWHLASDTQTPGVAWPTRCGFDEFYGILPGADSYFHPRNLWHNETRLPIPESGYYFTDAISQHAAEFIESHTDRPFFLYLAHTAPHWPLHAPEEDIERYMERYLAGWDRLRAERHDRLRKQGLLGQESSLRPRDPRQPAWEDVEHQEWEARRMATYAAMVERMDAGIGRVLDAVESTGRTENTLVVFLSDNGASSENLPPSVSPHFFKRQPSHTPSGRPMQIGNEPHIAPGRPDTYTSYGRSWANLSNAPFRLYKRWVHEGGISSPLIVSWPDAGLPAGHIVRAPFQLTDLVPTIAEATGIGPAGAGISMLRAFGGDEAPEHPLFWEHVGNAAMRDGNWKLVREADQPWELYDLSTDRAEEHDRAAEHPDVVSRMESAWQAWADEVGVIPWERMKEITAVHGG